MGYSRLALTPMPTLPFLLALATAPFAAARPPGTLSPATAASSADVVTTEPFLDPRRRSLPRPNRLRLAARTQYVQLTQMQGEEQGESKLIRFHFAPLLLDIGYQRQFLRYFMARPVVQLGPNLANSRNAMPWVVAPGLHAGYQGRLLGLAAAYNYLLPFPALINATSATSATPQPVMWNNHIVSGELSITSRVDRVAISAFAGVGAVRTDLSHASEKREDWWRLTISGGLAFYFDGSIRRARQQAEAEAPLSRRTPRPRRRRPPPPATRRSP
ncbi:MAG: hypothetical protein B7733_25045 [Myxococcales bacterium FL481]|nr:MAG: hypothetical protein B7733_25045 [Myxococcales bacterium FL481]